MALNIDFVMALIKLINNNYFDENLFNEFIKTKALKAFINHENAMGRNTDITDIKEELIRLIEYKSYEDKYDFHLIKGNIHKLKIDMDYLYNNGNLVIQKALKRVYDIISEDIEIKTDIYLYAGSIDGGFTVNRKEIYINYLNYIGEREEFIKILSHELYHSRKIPLKSKLKFRIHTMMSKNRYGHILLGRIIEEGIACLIQHGPILTKDDITGNLTRRSLFLTQVHFNGLREVLLNMKHGSFKRVDLKRINIYAIGYIIVTSVYSEEKIFLLDQWTVDLYFKNIIREYINLSKIKSNLPTIDEEAILWII